MTCPNCGAEVGSSESYCRECGQPVVRPPEVATRDEKKGLSSGARNILLAISVALLVLVGVPSCLLGGCFLVVGTMSGSTPRGHFDWQASLGGMLGIAIFGLLVWAVVAFSRKR